MPLFLTSTRNSWMGISAISAALPTLIDSLEKASTAAATLTSLSDRESGTLTCTTFVGILPPSSRYFSASLKNVLLGLKGGFGIVRLLRIFWLVVFV